MAFQLTPFQFFDNNGDPLSGGRIYVYSPGTVLDKDSYPTADDADEGTNANLNPVVLDSSGRGQIWGKDGETYKVAVKTSADVLLDTIDDIAAPDVATNAKFQVYAAAGSANAQTLAYDLDAYADSPPIYFIPAADNTGACTLNVNGLGAKSIKDSFGNDLVAGDLSGLAVVHYDGTNFVLLNPSQPRIYSGYVSSDGTTGNNLESGWSASKISAGLYEITHNLGASTTALHPFAIARGANVYSAVPSTSTTVIQFRFLDAAGTPTDTDFYFTATIPARNR